MREEIDAPCPSFAFPNGNYTAELAQYAIRCGVKMVMTTEPTWVDESSALWRLPRLQFFGPDSPGKIKLKIAAAATGRILKNPDGTGKTYRAVNRLAKRKFSANLVAAKIDNLLSDPRPQVET